MTTKPTIPPYLGVNQQFLTLDWNNEIVQQGNWTNEMILGTNGISTIAPAALAALPQGGANLVTNANFGVWQRGVSFASASATLTADAWNAANVAVTQDASNQESGLYCLKAAAMATNAGVYQAVIAPQLGGLTVTFAVRVKSTVGVVAYLFDGAKFITGSPTTGSGAYETAYCTGVIAASPSTLQLNIVTVATGDVYIDNAMLTCTPAPIPFFPTHPAEEWRRCQSRYAAMIATMSFNATATGQYREVSINFPQPMIVAPTSLFWSGGTLGNIAVASGIITGSVDQYHATAIIQAAGAGYVYAREIVLAAATQL